MGRGAFGLNNNGLFTSNIDKVDYKIIRLKNTRTRITFVQYEYNPLQTSYD